MAQRLFLLLLFTGFVHLVLSITRKYYLVQGLKTWHEARLYCLADYKGIAIIRGNQDMIELQKEIQKLQYTSTAWIGLYLNTVMWRWSMGEEGLGSFRPWSTSEPNNYNGKEACVVILGSMFRDSDCSVPNLFVCFDGNYTGGQSYILITTPMTWYDARAYCRQHHTDLASSRDNAENVVISGLSNSMVWVGLYRDNWKWRDGTPVSNLSWATGQPDNANYKEECAAVSNTGISDSLCADTMPVFCYKDVMKQVVRVTVRSSEDVNDLTVKAAILEQIKQNVNRNIRLAGKVTVDWVEQPDGAVFH